MVDHISNVPAGGVRRDLTDLAGALDDEIPKKKRNNILIATWNIRSFGNLTRKWRPGSNDSPKRDLVALRSICEILKRFDVIAVQEVVGNLKALREAMDFLGDDWSFLMTDITHGDEGNNERLAFVFHNKRVKPSGLACEVVIPPDWISRQPEAVSREQFARTPYAVSFSAGNTTFILLTTHVLYGDHAMERVPELQNLALWMLSWATQTNRYHQNLLLLGDFNIDRMGDPLWDVFTSTGLHVPDDLHHVKRSIFIGNDDDPRTDKFYDQIAWFNSASGRAQIRMEYLRGGGFDFLPYVYTGRGISKRSISFRMSDHYPLWVEFKRA